jgi:hypothetical protein
VNHVKDMIKRTQGLVNVVGFALPVFFAHTKNLVAR